LSAKPAAKGLIFVERCGAITVCCAVHVQENGTTSRFKLSADYLTAVSAGSLIGKAGTDTMLAAGSQRIVKIP
jgi:hypothetical protein